MRCTGLRCVVVFVAGGHLGSQPVLAAEDSTPAGQERWPFNRLLVMQHTSWGQYVLQRRGQIINEITDIDLIVHYQLSYRIGATE